MKHQWTVEKLLILTPARLEILRQNALKVGDVTLAAQCSDIQMSRKQSASSIKHKSTDPVLGFHFVCESDYEVTLLPDGKFWSGVWVVDQFHCDPAVEMKAYVALHTSKREPSYRQGTIVDWRLEPRTKGTRETGVSFLLDPLKDPITWHGGGSGEKGYRRSSAPHD